MKSSEMRLLYIILAKLFCSIWMPHFFLYKWHVFKKFKNSLEACFYKHCFYIFIINLGENKIIECLVPIWKLFVERQTSGTLYRRMTTGDDEWQQMTMSDNEWQRVVQRMGQRVVQWVTTNENEWQWMKISDGDWQGVIDNKCQRVTANDNEWYNEWKWIRTSKKKSDFTGFKIKQNANLVPE